MHICICTAVRNLLWLHTTTTCNCAAGTSRYFSSRTPTAVPVQPPDIFSGCTLLLPLFSDTQLHSQSVCPPDLPLLLLICSPSLISRYCHIALKAFTSNNDTSLLYHSRLATTTFALTPLSSKPHSSLIRPMVHELGRHQVLFLCNATKFSLTSSL